MIMEGWTNKLTLRTDGLTTDVHGCCVGGRCRREVAAAWARNALARPQMHRLLPLPALSTQRPLL